MAAQPELYSSGSVAEARSPVLAVAVRHAPATLAALFCALFWSIAIYMLGWVTGQAPSPAALALAAGCIFLFLLFVCTNLMVRAR